MLGKAFVVGIDWGALVAWYLSLLRPDRVKEMVALCVPFTPRFTNVKPIESFRKMFRDDNYVCQFQEPERAERAFAMYDCLTVMKKLILINKTDMLIAPPGIKRSRCLLISSRSLDSLEELLAPWQGSKITVLAKLIVGDKDIGFDSGGIRAYIEGSIFKTLVPDHEIVILDGHHFIQQERPHEVSREIFSFL
ncbi:hypothetical protein BUALT_Bualt01G0144300 [Buddleja alternifolia]|uniref:AB hydrolase-1 domain-containing protein n=1 Tax=Buddleja alternifolia TaxID=168488 RepID=A0AAV6YCZ5_9LAMI|nr:hypothetical protein BUALT_Bualt01G0144300 [Buddleja alternifolia]